MSTNETQSTAGGKILDTDTKVDHDRLNAIADARAALRDARQRSRAALVKGSFTKQQANAWYLDAVQTLLLELRPFAEIDDHARSFWMGRGVTLATVTVDPPPQESNEWERTSDVETTTTYEELEPVVVAKHNGLLDTLRSPLFQSFQFAYAREERHGPDMQYTATVQTSVSRLDLDLIVEEALAFANAVGLDLSLEDKDDRMKI